MNQQLRHFSLTLISTIFCAFFSFSCCFPRMKYDEIIIPPNQINDDVCALVVEAWIIVDEQKKIPYLQYILFEIW